MAKRPTKITDTATGMTPDISAVWVNKFHILLTGDGRARITFGEASLDSGPVAARTAVMMTVDNAVALKDLIAFLTTIPATLPDDPVANLAAMMKDTK